MKQRIWHVLHVSGGRAQLHLLECASSASERLVDLAIARHSAAVRIFLCLSGKSVVPLVQCVL